MSQAVAPPQAPPRAAARPSSPYKGLRPYTEADAALFFGRDSESQIIGANLIAARLTLLYGPSGVGKSSVLAAGVVHDLRERARANVARGRPPGFAVVAYSSWRDEPIGGLGAAIRESVAELVDHELEDPPEGARLDELLEHWIGQLGGRLLIVLDQFEEYFLYHGDDGPGTFAVEFPRAVNRRDLPASFLISIREDALAKLDRFKGPMPYLFDNYLRIDLLDDESARLAIEEALAEYSRLAGTDPVTAEPKLVDAVLDEIRPGKVSFGQSGAAATPAAHGDRIEAPFLQLVMERLWKEEREAGSDVLRLATFERLGGANGIVGAHVDERMDALPDPDKDVAARIFNLLVTPSGTKSAETPADLAFSAGLEEEDVGRVLARLAAPEARIVRPVAPLPGAEARGSRYEIAHDALGEAILAWRAHHVQERARAEANARAARERLKARIYRGVAALALVVACLVGGLAVWAVHERHTAQATTQLARAESALTVDPALSIRLARDALGKRNTGDVRVALLDALSLSHALAVIRHRKDVADVAFSPDGTQVVTAGADGTARIADARTGAVAHVLRDGRGSLYAVAFSPDGSRVLTAGGRSTTIWDARSGRPLHRLPGSSGAYHADFSPDGRLVLGRSPVAFRIWDVATGRRVNPPIGVISAGNWITAASWSPDGRLIATGQALGTVRLWSPRGRLVAALRTHSHWIAFTAFSLDGRLLAAAGDDGVVHVWDVRAHDAALEPLQVGDGPTAAAFGPGHRLALAVGKSVVVLDLATGEKQTLLGHVDWVNDVEFDPSGKLVVSASEDGTARVWDTASGQTLYRLLGHDGAVRRAVFGAGGTLVATASADRTARTWDVSSGRELRPGAGWVLDATFSPDGGEILAATQKGAVGVWSARSGKPVPFVPVTGGGGRPGAPPPSAARAPGGAEINAVDWRGDRFVTAGADGTITVSDVQTGAPKVSLNAASAVIDAAFSPDGTHVVTGDENWDADIWNLATRKSVALTGQSGYAHDGEVSGVAYGPDGRVVVTTGLDGLARVWDAATGKLLRSFSGHEGPVYSPTFDPKDPKLVATVGQDRTARIWNIETGREAAVLRDPSGGLRTAAFSPDGTLLATAGVEGVTRVWSWRARSLVAVLRVHSDFVNSVEWSRDGRSILTASDDGTVKLNPCETCRLSAAELRALAARRIQYLPEKER